MLQKTLTIFALLFIPSLVFGATYASFPSQEVSYNEGQTFQLPIYIGSSDGEKIFTAKVALAYDPQFLEAISFAFQSGSLPLAQEGYDKLDNVSGVLIKTAGYPGGVSAHSFFGTVTFKSKKAGSTTIQISEDTRTFNASNQNTISSRGVVAVALSPAQTQVIEEQEVSEPVHAVREIEEVGNEQVDTPTVQIPEKMNPVLFATLSLLAVVNPLVFIILALACLVGVFYLIRMNHKKRWK